jgi:hypothetical protein
MPASEKTSVSAKFVENDRTEYLTWQQYEINAFQRECALNFSSTAWLSLHLVRLQRLVPVRRQRLQNRQFAPFRGISDCPHVRQAHAW